MEHHFSYVDHNVTVASGPVKAAVRVQVPLINPYPSPVAQLARASDFESEGWRCISVRGRSFFPALAPGASVRRIPIKCRPILPNDPEA